MKTVYLIVDGKQEHISFSSTDSLETVIHAFQVAAGAHFDAILKLKAIGGGLIAIASTMNENTSQTPYLLEVTPPHCGKDLAVQREELSRLIQSCEALVSNMKSHVANEHSKETQGENKETEKIDIVTGFKTNLEELHASLKDAKRLACLGLQKRKAHPLDVDPQLMVKQRRQLDEQIQLYLEMNIEDISMETRNAVMHPSFNNWPLSGAEVMELIEYFFYDLNLLEEFSIDRATIKTFVIRLSQNYNHNPFHNFQHCFCVTQMMYCMIKHTYLCEKMSTNDILALIIASACHDLDHPGFSNDFQISAQTELALRYNDMSPLEQHHGYMTFQLLCEPEANILKNVDEESFRSIRQSILCCILATDMKQHRKTIANFKAILPTFSFENREHCIELMQILIKSADISNEVRPISVAELWYDRLLAEFFQQADYEKANGYPFAFRMEDSILQKAKSQIGFISYCILPLLEVLCSMFPELKRHMLEPVKASLQYYKDIEMSSFTPTEASKPVKKDT